MGGIYIGTSGWVYKGWEKAFYPEDLTAKEHFEFYATQFPTVEINATFYRLPTLNMVKGWRDRAPRGFVFAIKGSRYLTHIKKLTDLGGSLNRFFRRIQPLESRIGAILWQLPPYLKKDAPRLKRFLKRLPSGYRHAVEFRDRSWLDEEIFGLLRAENAAHVWVSSLRMPENFVSTADFIYIRFHGLAAGAAHDYSPAELEPWAGHIRPEAQAGKAVFAYFNNDANVRAPANAKLLMDLVGPGAVHAASESPDLPPSGRRTPAH